MTTTTLWVSQQAQEYRGADITELTGKPLTGATVELGLAPEATPTAPTWIPATVTINGSTLRALALLTSTNTTPGAFVIWYRLTLGAEKRVFRSADYLVVA